MVEITVCCWGLVGYGTCSGGMGGGGLGFGECGRLRGVNLVGVGLVDRIACGYLYYGDGTMGCDNIGMLLFVDFFSGLLVDRVLSCDLGDFS